MKRRSGRIGVTLGVMLLGVIVASAGEGRQPLATPAELDSLLAPVALYPDPILSQVLAASSFPLDIVAAERWLQAHPDLGREALVRATERQPWDPSVKALTAFPTILARMSENLEWTQRLGAAVQRQEEQVLEAVQRLRGKAYAAGHLDTSHYVRVVHKGPLLLLEPPPARILYVPYYEPRAVYGAPFGPAPARTFPFSSPGSVSVNGVSWRAGVPASSIVLAAGFDWNRFRIVARFGRWAKSPRPYHRRESIRIPVDVRRVPSAPGKRIAPFPRPPPRSHWPTARPSETVPRYESGPLPSDSRTSDAGPGRRSHSMGRSKIRHGRSVFPVAREPGKRSPRPRAYTDRDSVRRFDSNASRTNRSLRFRSLGAERDDALGGRPFPPGSKEESPLRLPRRWPIR